MNIEQAIIDIKHFSQTHIDWAEYFEKNPNIESEYLKTGKWSSAIEHREIVSKYDNVLKILEHAKTETSNKDEVLNLPDVIKSCDNCKFVKECRHKGLADNEKRICKFYVEHVL
jgi:hypothetical protein